ncbi:hypothetical protein HIM_00636 [Hirsutella minnesotensis 3608]|nr:hypothetical protein HIM_00636 [Hirsutella minnesotensis 3608]
MALDKPENKDSISYKHMLVSALVNNGKYAEALDLAGPVLKSLDERLGKDSPQALSPRRMITGALCDQGPAQCQDAQRLLNETRCLIDNMNHGSYASFQDGERQVTDTLEAELKGLT